MSEREAINPDGTITLYDQRTDSYVTVPFDLTRKQLIYHNLPPEQTHLLHDIGLDDQGERMYSIECFEAGAGRPCPISERHWCGLANRARRRFYHWDDLLNGTHPEGPGPWYVAWEWDTYTQRQVFVVSTETIQGEQDG